MRERASVVVCVPFYFCADRARADITRRVFRSLVGVTILGIGSEGELSERLFIEHHPKSRYREYVQDWPVPGGAGSEGLRHKFDFAMQAAREYRPDTVFILGSDDFMLDADLRASVEYFAPSKADLIVASGGVYVWEYGKTRVRRYEHPCPTDLQHTGGALGFSRQYLDSIKWRPFQNPSCEVGAERLVRDSGGIIEARPNACLTVRGNVVLNRAQAVQRRWRGTQVPVEPFAGWWSDLGTGREPLPPLKLRRSVSVLIPFAGQDPDRLRALGWVRAKYQQLGYEVVVGYGDENNWCKADAVADALARSTGEVLVIADGDVWADDIEYAVHAPGWTVPHKKVYRLDKTATASVLAGAAPDIKMGCESKDGKRPSGAYTGVTGGGILVVPRDLYEQVPLDRRFVGFGSEDYAWGYALTTIAGPAQRFDGNLWHLCHSKQIRESAFGSVGNNALRKRYREARKSPALMRALMDEVANGAEVPPRSPRPSRKVEVGRGTRRVA